MGVLNCFRDIHVTGSSCLLDSGVVDPKDDTYNFNISRGCQDDCMRACPIWMKAEVCFVLFCFFFLIFNPYLISWLIGRNTIAQRNECPFQGLLGIWWKTFPKAWRCWEISWSASCWWSPFSFSITGGGLSYKISKGE